MKQKGEGLLFFVMVLLCLSGLLLLSALELKKSFSLLEKRTHLYLCAKETKGEFMLYLILMGRTNWAIKNLNRLKLITMIIPGLQGVSGNADRARRILQGYQNYKLISHLNTLRRMKQKGCFLDPQLFITPFMLNAVGYQRDNEGAALLRKTKWTYYYLQKPYLLTHEVDLQSFQRPKPKIVSTTKESTATFSSLWSSR
jgi:hypothetical protein